MPYELMCGAGEELRRELLSMGLAIEPRQRMEFGRYLQHKTPKKRMLCTSRTGWTGSGAFVLPDGVIGPGADGVVFQDGGRIGKGHGVAGTVESWRNSVARLAIGNPMMIFGVSAGFAPPLMELTHTEGGGFNFVGGSSSGKTTILEAARSTFGGPDFKRSWRATSNGVEGVAEQHNDLFFVHGRNERGRAARGRRHRVHVDQWRWQIQGHQDGRQPAAEAVAHPRVLDRRAKPRGHDAGRSAGTESRAECAPSGFPGG